tara:strand:+ start:589 stop:1518 length:930 start_codon:yes stop_codon:yes gene_type:complete
MELKNPFLEIKRLKERINGDDITDSFTTPLDPLETIKIELEQGEIQVDRNQIISHGPFLLYEGKILAILYIYDYRATQEDLLSESVDKKAPKFHFSWCRTLSEMDKRGKFARYIFSRKKHNKFKVQATERDPAMIRKLGEHHEMEDVTLYACKNCLNETGYKGYSKDLSAYEKNKHVFDFNIKEFLDENEATVSTSRFYLEQKRVKFSDETVQPMIYTDDFPEISRKLRASKDWKCTKCNIDMSRHKSGLHTHHKNGVKNDNSNSNLQVLCALCHKNIDSDHKGMYVNSRTETYILRNSDYWSHQKVGP